MRRWILVAVIAVALVLLGQPLYFAGLAALAALLLHEVLATDDRRAGDSRVPLFVASGLLVVALALDVASRAQDSNDSGLSWASTLAWVVAVPIAFVVTLRSVDHSP